MTENIVDSKQEHGSFSSGLVMGFLAGAVGYFLVQTKEGKEIREKFSDHWHDLRERLIAEGKLSPNESEITEYIAGLRNKISEFLGDCLDDQAMQKKSLKKKPGKIRKKSLFKGI